MKGQKEAVVELVKQTLGTRFTPFKDKVLLLLTSSELENIKADVFNLIINGIVEYSKDKNNHNEARTYARSMVMNHLKKAKELNGNLTQVAVGVTSSGVPARVFKRNNIPKGVDAELLPEDLKEFVSKLV